jgi:predicted DNA-binding antitoxin AbrB/MazE fold protein
MTLVVDAAYENGMLRLASPLPLEEQQRVRVIVHPEPTGSEAHSPRHEPAPIKPEPDRAASDDEPADWEMVDIVLNVPPSPDAITVIPRWGPLPLPDPPVIPPSDDETE